MLKTSILCFVMVLCAVSSAQAALLPKVVAAHIQDLEKSCAEIEGKLQAKKMPEGRKFIAADYIRHGILKGSTVEIWTIDEGLFECDNAASLFSGSGGSQVYIFTREGQGEAKESFFHGSYGLKVEKSASSLELWLQVGGPLCGQTGEHSHADSILCERPLIWDSAAHKIDFAPLSTIRPFKLIE